MSTNTPEDDNRRAATQTAIAAQAATDEAARRAASRQIGEVLRLLQDPDVTATIEQLTDDKALVRLSDGSFRWVDRSEIG